IRVYIMAAESISIEVVDQEGTLLEVRISGPFGMVQLIGEVRIDGRTLYFERVHMSGPGPGTVARSGLNAIGRRILEEADVDQIVVEGSTRTTGRNAGRLPKPFKYPRH